MSVNNTIVDLLREDKLMIDGTVDSIKDVLERTVRHNLYDWLSKPVNNFYYKKINDIAKYTIMDLLRKVIPAGVSSTIKRIEDYKVELLFNKGLEPETLIVIDFSYAKDFVMDDIYINRDPIEERLEELGIFDNKEKV